MKMRTCGICLVLAVSGCRMGQDPWDYSGPVQGSAPIPYSATTTRSGSAFNGATGSSNPMAAPTVPTPETKPPASDESNTPDPVTTQPRRSTIRR